MRQITSIQLHDILDIGMKMNLLDVRETNELKYGVISNSIHISMKNIAAKMDELGQLKKDPIVIICRSGKRSNKVGQYLEKAGFNDLINLAGGMNEWATKIDNSMTVY
ncbi:MAG: rhodanese-like domain-containing protein [Piscirickettsiaceae bacterium]|nr:rhodanese-like domain-containing protein [Piscirickettsiaceae bacterium]